MVMVLLIVVFVTAGCLLVRSRLSVEHPGKLQIVLEDAVGAVIGLLDEWIGPEGPPLPAAHRHARASSSCSATTWGSCPA